MGRHHSFSVRTLEHLEERKVLSHVTSSIAHLVKQFLAGSPHATPVTHWHAGHHHVASPHRKPAGNLQLTIPMPTPTSSPTPTPIPAPVTLSDTAQAIVDLVNQQRQQNGLAPLQVNARLVQAAQIHANDMAQFQQMAHTLPGAALPTVESRAASVGYNYSWLGENIAFAYPNAAAVMNGWMNSPDHRANILNPHYTEIGVGVAYDGNGFPYYCQDFGQPG